MNIAPLVERYFAKRRSVVEYSLKDRFVDKMADDGMVLREFDCLDEAMIAYEYENMGDEFRSFLAYRSSRNGSDWRIFTISIDGVPVAFSSLHVPGTARWLDSLPTFDGEARESGSFVDDAWRGRRLRARLLSAQVNYCIRGQLKLWAVIESSNYASLRSSFAFGVAKARANILIKFFGYNVASVLRDPFQVYIAPRFRGRVRS